MFADEAVVIDVGSSTIKAGFAGQDAPHIGDEAMSKRGVLKLQYPIQRGIITDWDAIETMYLHTYHQLQAQPEQRPLFITEPPHNPKRNREKMVELLFEKLKVPSTYISLPAIAIVCASGRMPVIVLDIGEGVTHVLPMYTSAYTVREAITRFNFGGKDVTDYMATQLNSRGNSFFTSAELEIVKDIKHKLGYAALDYKSELSHPHKQQAFELPDGRVIEIGEERFASPEILFSPFLAGLPFPGIHEMIHTAISKCDVDLRSEFYSHVVVSGGSSMFPGLAERLKREMTILVPHNQVSVVAAPERKYSAWIGGSILASLSSFQSCFIDYQEYLEVGPSIVHKKCL